MRRIQAVLIFWSLLSLSVFVAAVRADAGGLSFDMSLIGYDDRGRSSRKTIPKCSRANRARQERIVNRAPWMEPANAAQPTTDMRAALRR